MLGIECGTQLTWLFPEIIGIEMVDSPGATRPAHPAECEAYSSGVWKNDPMGVKCLPFGRATTLSKAGLFHKGATSLGSSSIGEQAIVTLFNQGDTSP